VPVPEEPREAAPIVFQPVEAPPRVGPPRPISPSTPTATPADVPVAAALSPSDERPDGPVTNYWRVLYASGLFVSVTMLLFSYLDRSVVGSSVFGALAVLCLILLVLPGRAED
jgi:hypothetical protein